MTLPERYLRVASLYERDDCVQINGQWHVPLTGLGAVLAEFGLKIVAEPRGYTGARCNRHFASLVNEAFYRCGCRHFAAPPSIQDVPGSHGVRRDAVTAGDVAHETAPGRSFTEGG